MTKAKFDLYASITDNILKAFEAGTRPWNQPWTSKNDICRPLSGISNQPYRGINVLNLWAVALINNYKSNYWLTFSAIQKLNPEFDKNMTKAEKAAMPINVRGKPSNARVCFFTVLEKEQKNGDIKRFPLYTSTPVWNADQINNCPEKFAPVEYTDIAQNDGTKIEHCETFFRNTEIDIINGNSEAYYTPLSDSVHMPDLETFESAEAYYSVLAHECAHATGSKERLNRPGITKHGAKNVYAFEELIAEIASAFVNADLGIEGVGIEKNAAYVASWIKVLKNDKMAIFEAAKYAEKAANWLNDKQVKVEKAA